jgi:hypothetical protein
MEQLLTACACGLDPGSETMLVQAGLAVVISTPFWFRARILNALRMFSGRREMPASEECPGLEAHD